MIVSKFNAVKIWQDFLRKITTRNGCFTHGDDDDENDDKSKISLFSKWRTERTMKSDVIKSLRSLDGGMETAELACQLNVWSSRRKIYPLSLSRLLVKPLFDKEFVS